MLFILRYIGVTEDFVTETPTTSMLPTVAPPLSTTTSISSVASPSNNPTSSTTPMTATSSSTPRPNSRNRGVIFPSVKNKPTLTNSSFTSDILINYKDVKVFELFVWFLYVIFNRLKHLDRYFHFRYVNLFYKRKQISRQYLYVSIFYSLCIKCIILLGLFLRGFIKRWNER